MKLHELVLAAACLLYAPTAVARENPCSNPDPSAECENLLAEMALHWEKQYHEERASHISTLALCATTIPVMDKPEAPLWISVALVVGGVLVGAGAVGVAFAL